MANEYNLGQAGTMSPEDYAQQQSLNRQQQMAQLLMQQGTQQPQGQMVSGRYVPTSFFQNLLPIANIAASQYVGNKADTEAAKLAQRIRDAKGAKEQAITSLITGMPEVKTELAGPYAGNVPMPVATKEAVKPDLAAALREISTNNPYGAGAEYKAAIIGNMIPKTPEKVAEFNFAKQNGFKGSYNDFVNQMTPYQQAQLGIEQQKLGMEQQKLQNELSGGKLTDAQGNATAFGMRAKESNALLSQLEQGGTKNTGILRSTAAGIVGATPFIGEKLEQGVSNAMNTLPSFLGGPNAAQQATDQARRNFVTAVLRKESGAAISPGEFATESLKYFPQPGDDDSVIRQKQHARETAIKALEVQAGPGANIIRQLPTPKLDVGGDNNSGWRMK